MSETPTASQKALWNEQMRQWNGWQARVGESPAEYLDFSLQQSLEFLMSHRLRDAGALLWMEKQLAEKGLEAIHTLRLPGHEPKKDHHVSVFRVGTESYAILEGHHRLAAACLLAYRQPGSQWQSLIRLRVHSPDAEIVRLWQASVPEMDGQMLSRFPMLRGACATVGTIREYLADGRWTPDRSTRISAAVLVLYDNEGRVLLQLRDARAPVYAGHWGFFGGRIEEGETPLQALLREVQEELAYTPESPTLLCSLPYRDDTTCRQGVRHYFLQAYEDGVPLTLGEGAAIQWFSIAEVRSLRRTPSVEAALDAIGTAIPRAICADEGSTP